MFQHEKAIEKSRLGELLVSKGLVTRFQLEQALEAQRETGKKLGEVLVGWGWISERQLNRALTRQKSYRYAIAFAAAVSAPLAPALSFANSNNNNSEVTATAVAGDAHLAPRTGGLAALDDEALGDVAGQGLASDVESVISGLASPELTSKVQLPSVASSALPGLGNMSLDTSNPSGSAGLNLLSSVTKVLLPFDEDVKISGLTYSGNQTPTKINADGSMEFELPARIDSVEFNNIRPKGLENAGSMGNVALVGVNMNNVTMRVNIRS